MSVVPVLQLRYPLFLYSNYSIPRASKLKVIAVGHWVLMLSPTATLRVCWKLPAYFLSLTTLFTSNVVLTLAPSVLWTWPAHLAVTLLLLTVTHLSVSISLSRYTVVATTQFVRRLIVSPFNHAVPIGGYIAADEVQWADVLWKTAQVCAGRPAVLVCGDMFAFTCSLTP